MTALRPILDVADELGLPRDSVIPWGRHKAKVDPALAGSAGRRGDVVLVSAINPTPPGEGKTTTSIALAMGLRKRGTKVIPALREPSLGPVFGVKGGGTGGGQAQLEPAQDINLHFTGDIHAVTTAHNLLSALVDNAAYFGEPVAIDPRTVTWPRAMDMNDRFLRGVLVGLGGKAHGIPRETRFDITAASEVMAILGLSTSLKDLEERCDRIVVGRAPDGRPVRASDVVAGPSMAALLRDALMPNLVQTREGGPALVHGGPFANIAYGCSTLVATELARQWADVVVTESGFGFDLGGEKFFDIKCRAGGIWPRVVVLVATLRALKSHGGADPKKVADPDKAALQKGFEHLGKHLETVRTFGVPAVVAINRFPTDSDDEMQLLRDFCRRYGVPVASHEGFSKGGDGSLELADVVTDVLAKHRSAPIEPKFLYPLDASPEDKIAAIATKVYGADGVQFTAQAKKQLAECVELGGGKLPVCMAKTHLSLTDDPKKVGRPWNFEITVREVRLSAGAGYLVALTGELLTMPGLPREPAARRVVVHPDGRVTGLMQGE